MSNKSPIHLESMMSWVSWSPHGHDKRKINPNASNWNNENCCGGVSWVVHDSFRSLKGVSFRKICHEMVYLWNSSNHQCFTLSIFSWFIFLFSIVVEFSVTEVVNLINNSSINFTDIKDVVDKIRDLTSLLGPISFSYYVCVIV